MPGRRGNRDAGRITLLVSHRFSTVRTADLIVAVDGSRLVEAGTHDALIARRRQYADLYGIQAAPYRCAVGQLLQIIQRSQSKFLKASALRVTGNVHMVGNDTKS